jgi:hypothetical protein
MANGQAGQKQQLEEKTLTPGQLEAGKKWLQLVTQVRADKALKQRLIDTPIAVLKEQGINVRDGLDIRVVENTDNVVYLTLPAAAELSRELTVSELDAAVGGDLTEYKAAEQPLIFRVYAAVISLLQ